MPTRVDQQQKKRRQAADHSGAESDDASRYAQENHNGDGKLLVHSPSSVLVFTVVGVVDIVEFPRACWCQQHHQLE
jgi:hypothetical protein